MENDAHFVTECHNGDSEAFGILYNRYIDKIYRFIYYKTFSKEITEDLTSDVFHKALTRLHTFDPRKGSFSTWIYRIARNTVVDYYRTKKTTVPIEDIFDIGVDDRMEDVHDAVHALTDIKKYLTTLTPRQREIITLRIWEGKSYREIAEIVESTEDGVKMAFSRSIRDLREKYGARAILLLITYSYGAALPFDNLSYYTI